MTELFSGLQLAHELILLTSAVLCIMTLALYVINLRANIKNGDKDTKGNVAALLTVYPVS